MRNNHKLCLWRKTTRYLLCILAVNVSLLGVFVNTISADTLIFQDDFEDTTLNAWIVQPTETWTNSVSNAHSGTRKARVSGNVEGAVLRKELPTTGFTDVTVTFWHDTNTGWDLQDLLELQWTSNGGSTWNTVVTLDGDDLTPSIEGAAEWIEHTVALGTEASNAATFGIRFVATISGASDIIYIDDVQVRGTSTAPVTPTPTVTVTPTPTVTVIPTQSVTPTIQPTVMPTPTPTKAPTPTVAPTVMVTPTATPTPLPDNENQGSAMTLIKQLLKMLLRLLFTRTFSLFWHLS